MMVAPERETPGISASVWQHPDGCRAGERCVFRRVHERRGTEPLDENHHDAADHEGRRDDARALVEHALDEIGQEQPEHRSGDEGGQDHERKAARRRVGPQAADDRSELGAIEPHDGEDRAELDRDGEDIARILEVQQPRPR